LLTMSKLKKFDDQFRKNKLGLVSGFDEAGRGPLCGPVVAAGVILPPDFDSDIINDSKQMTDKKRREMFKIIKDEALFYHISVISPQTIDKINILEASRLGMQQALDEMIKRGFSLDSILTDYMDLNSHSAEIVKLKKGDSKSLSIAAASILAKVTRDDIMIELDKKYPGYNLAKNKGYPTKEHLEALRERGVIKEIYRLSYAPVEKLLQMKLF